MLSSSSINVHGGRTKYSRGRQEVHAETCSGASKLKTVIQKMCMGRYRLCMKCYNFDEKMKNKHDDNL